MRTVAASGYKKRRGRAAIKPLGRASVLTLGRYVTNDSFYGEILYDTLQTVRRNAVRQ